MCAQKTNTEKDDKLYLTREIGAPCSYMTTDNKTTKQAATMMDLSHNYEGWQYNSGEEHYSDYLGRFQEKREQLKKFIPYGFTEGLISAKFNACANCKACVPSRINVNNFKPSRSQKRAMRRNNDLLIEVTPRHAQSLVLPLGNDHFNLFQYYQKLRHKHWNMAKYNAPHFFNSFQHYDLLLEITDPMSGSLQSFAIFSEGQDFLNGIGHFYDPTAAASRSLGHFTILSALEYCQMVGIDYLYLGSWVKDSMKLGYKSRYSGFELMTDDGWEAYAPNKTYQTPNIIRDFAQEIAAQDTAKDQENLLLCGNPFGGNRPA